MAERKPRTIAALAKRRRTKQVDDDALAELHEAIVDDLDAGVTQKALVEITGYSRENIRLIAKAIRQQRAQESRQSE
jgi:hypothetical protein